MLDIAPQRGKGEYRPLTNTYAKCKKTSREGLEMAGASCAMVSYKIKTLEKAFQDLKAYLNKKQQEVKQAANFVKIPGVNERMAQVLRILDSDPDRILNIKEVQSRFDVSDYTARSDLKALVGLGFLEVVQVNKQKQNFIRSDGFDDILAQYLHK